MQETLPYMIPIVLFLVLGVLCAGLIWLAWKSRQEHHETIRKALELGQPLDPDVLKAFGRPSVGPEADLRGGVIVACVGLAFLIVAGLNATTGGDLDGTRIAVFIGILALGFGSGRLLVWKLQSGKAA